MRTRLTLTLALVAGLPSAASAQETFLALHSWQEVIAGTVTPVSTPNGIVEPGEAARIRLGVTALVNGTNAIGQNVTYTDPSPGGIGTIKGLGYVAYDLVGDQNASTAFGTWGGFIGGFQSVPGQPFGAPTVPPGVVQPGGASIYGLGSAQFIASGPGVTANPTNHNVQIFRGVWQPDSYAAREVRFVSRGSVFVPAGEHNCVLIAYGYGTDPVTGQQYDLYAPRMFGSTFGEGVTIPIAPAPSVIAVLGSSALVVGRRLRSRRSIPRTARSREPVT